jgi:hypothetical protein
MAVAYYEILLTAALSSEEILIVSDLTMDGHQKTVIWQSEVHLKLIFLSSEKALMAAHLPFEQVHVEKTMKIVVLLFYLPISMIKETE